MSTVEEGDFVRFTITDTDMDRLTASGYVDKIDRDIAIVRFGSKVYLPLLDQCELVCKQYKLDV